MMKRLQFLILTCFIGITLNANAAVDSSEKIGVKRPDGFFNMVITPGRSEARVFIDNLKDGLYKLYCRRISFNDSVVILTVEGVERDTTRLLGANIETRLKDMSPNSHDGSFNFVLERAVPTEEVEIRAFCSYSSIKK
jgi:hypothetical protein